ncbi:MAG: SIMPL domain-containing protein [Alphaproteobacteria bacterium]|nr:SIMPL domain-containing protein [Alphaproteobacteria bacterium]
MMRPILIAAFALITLIPAAANAETKDPVFLLNNDESLLHISATEQREVDQDLLIANLRIEVEDKSNKTVQNDVNTAMKKALDLAKNYKDVKAVTRGYNVYQYDRNGGRKDRTPDMVWKGQQSVELKSKNSEELLELAGKIQEAGFLMNGLSYTLSPEVAAQVQDEMLEAALEKLRTRAERAAKALGKSKAELKEINTNGNYVPQPPMYARGMEMMAMAADAKMAAPVASPGETTITMNVSAKALLK